ncbi:hypothetical protein DFH06DRAFT_712447 [Mycena polygramma]|nr:hypothetical protein DFH06DRAFT_712447 [Mycena polygramma]
MSRLAMSRRDNADLMSLVWPSPTPIASSAFSMTPLSRPAPQPIRFFSGYNRTVPGKPVQSATVVKSLRYRRLALSAALAAEQSGFTGPSKPKRMMLALWEGALHSYSQSSCHGCSVDTSTPPSRCLPYAGCQIASHLLECFRVHAPLLPFAAVVGEIQLTGPDFAQQLELGYSAYRCSRAHGRVVAAFP